MTDTRLLGQATRPKQVKLEVYDGPGMHGEGTEALVTHAREQLHVPLKWKPEEACLEGCATFHCGSFVKVVVQVTSDARIVGRVWANAKTARQWDLGHVEMLMEETKG